MIVENMDYAAIQRVLDEKAIQNIAIIDDAYDQPTGEMLGRETLTEFFALVAEDGEASQEVSLLGIDIEEFDSLDDEDILNLWRYRNKPTALGGYCKELFAGLGLDAKLKDLEPLEVALTKLNRDVKHYRSHYELPDIAFDLIFLDYFLGSLDTEEAIKSSILRLKQINEKCDASKMPRPLIILMSRTDLQLHPDKLRSFCEQSGHLGCRFRFIPKEGFKEETGLFLSLMELAESFKLAQTIENFLVTMVESLNNVRALFSQMVWQFDLSDYAYIQSLRLENEGENLGEYMLHLYSHFLDSVLVSNARLQVAKEEVNRLVFDQIPADHFEPSEYIADVYQKILFEEIQALPDLPSQLKLGDIFIKEIEGFAPAYFYLEEIGEGLLELSNTGFELELRAGAVPSFEALIVLNAACDLIFSDEACFVKNTNYGAQEVQQEQKKRGRSFPADTTVLLLKGNVFPIDQQPAMKKDKEVRTYLFKYCEEYFAIYWRIKEFLAIGYSDVFQELKSHGYKHAGRLRAPYALQLQQRFASNLTRVGVPAFPPTSVKVDVKAYIKDKKGRPLALQPENTFKNAATKLLVTKDSDSTPKYTCVFSRPFIDQLRKFIDLATSDQSSVDNKIRQKITTFISDPFQLRKFRGPIDLNKKAPGVEGYIRILGDNEELVMKKNDIILIELV